MIVMALFACNKGEIADSQNTDLILSSYFVTLNLTKGNIYATVKIESGNDVQWIRNMLIQKIK